MIKGNHQRSHVRCRSNFKKWRSIFFRRAVFGLSTGEITSFSKTCYSHSELQSWPFANPQIKSSLYAFASTRNGNYSTFNDWKWYFSQRRQCFIIQHPPPDEKYSLIPHVPTYDRRTRPRTTADTLIYYIAIRKNCSHWNEMDWIVCSAAGEAAHELLAGLLGSAYTQINVRRKYRQRRHRCRTHKHTQAHYIHLYIYCIHYWMQWYSFNFVGCDGTTQPPAEPERCSHSHHNHNKINAGTRRVCTRSNEK